MGKIRWSRFGVLALMLVALVAAACGGGGATATPTPPGQGGGGGDDEWDAIVAAAEMEGLAVVTHPGSDYEALIAKFREAYPSIPVNHEGLRPSEFTPKVLTEQANNQFNYDVWTTSTSNMNNVAKPQDAFQPMTPFLVSDDVTDGSNWQSGELMYTSDDEMILLHSLNVSQGMRVNTDVLAEIGFEDLNSAEQFSDPRLRGQIAIRPLSGQHGSSLQMTGFLTEYGEDFVRSLISDQEMVVIDNPGILANGIMDGDYAVTIGAANEVIDDCWNAGGCENIEVLLQTNYALGRGIGVMRNAPHENATKVFVNWFLSQEGQQAFVDAFSETATDGQHSLRVDVEPNDTPENLASVPNYDNLDNYSLQGTDFGAPHMEQVQAIWAELRG